MLARMPKNFMELCVLLSKKTKDVMRNSGDYNDGKRLEDQPAEDSEYNFTDEQIAWNPHPIERCNQRSMDRNLVAFRQILFHLTAP